MPRCDLQIELDNPDLDYRIGDEVTGHVKVSLDDQVNCQELTLRLFWTTHGRGNRNGEDMLSLTLYEGTWHRGEYVYPFSFKMPEGPLTYHGEYLNIDWFLEARADIPWRIDPKVKTELMLVSSPDAVVKTDSRVIEQQPKPLAEAFMLLAVLLVIGGIVNGLVWYFADDGFASGVVGLISLVFFFFGVLSVRNHFAQYKLGPVSMTVTPLTLFSGEQGSLSFGCKPVRPFKLNHIVADLKAYEEVVSGSGTNKTTYTHTIYKRKILLSDSRNVLPGQVFDKEVAFVIPENAPASFSSASNKVCWELTLTVDIDRWPDWSEDVILTVR